MSTETTILGIETSCDDTAAAVVRGLPGTAIGEILANEVVGQADLHAEFGGVVPEIAARAHAERIDGVARSALKAAGLSLKAVDSVAVTAGPGLIGGVLAGLMFAKGVAVARGLPVWAINHLAGHALSPRLVADVAFPYLMLLVSGGHCQFVSVEGPMTFRRLGGTIDDAPGEAFDKVARLLNLAQPGGPSVEGAARLGDPARFPFPRPLLDRDDCNLSFSGLKTAVARQAERLRSDGEVLSAGDVADICAGFQAALIDSLSAKTRTAMALFREHSESQTLAVAGGVAANAALREALETEASRSGFDLIAPPQDLCTDNAAMIAWAAAERMAVDDPDGLDVAGRARWPLDETSAPMLGSGRKGAKA